MRVHYALTLVFLALPGCSYGLGEAVDSLDKGVSGYEGQVTPLSRPYLLRLEEGPDPPYRFTMISNLNGSTQRISMILRTKVSANGEQRRSRTKVEEISIGSRTLNGDGVPIILGDAIGSSRGRVQTMDVDFPALRLADVEIPEEASKAYQQLISMFQALNFEWPEAPVEMDSEILSPIHIEKMFDLSSKGDGEEEVANPLKEILRNTVSVKIIGETYDDGVHCLVGVYGGAVEAEMKSGLFTLEMRGHVLINTQYGTLRRYAYVIESVIERSGRRYKSTSYYELKPETQDSEAL